MSEEKNEKSDDAKAVAGKLEIMRHSLSHILAAAILKLYPKTKFAIGPAVDNGFYYDIDYGKTKISDNDLLKIEDEMKNIVRANLLFEKFALPVVKALAREKKSAQIYKEEMIKDLKKAGEKTVSYYKLGEFEDLCIGPHIKSAGLVQNGSWKLEKLAGAYWRGDEKNKMLTRIYGLAFATKQELDNYLKMQEEAEKRDHKKLGKELGLFSMHDEGPGFPFFHPKGMIIWNEMIKYWKEEHEKDGYQEIKTPLILNKKLWEQSGHWDYYKENMYFTKIDETDYAIKPMNCPGGILVYKSNLHSYREFPIKMAEIGLVHRHELSGVLNGLLRVRTFNQDDAHIYCLESQIKDEVIKVIKLIDRIYKTYGLKYHMELSTKPENSMGSEKMWQTAEKALESALKEIGGEYKLNSGDGAFYGPKIDFHIKDAIGRTWQCGTIQLDFTMPERFNLDYIERDGKEKRPVMIHRTVYGAIERFLGILIEHYAGAFPIWLSPVQVKIVSVGAAHVEFCRQLAGEFKQNDIRVEVDESDETVGNKIRRAVAEKVPYILVIGDREMASDPSASSGQGKLAVRDRGEKTTREIGKEEFIKEVKNKIKEKK